MEKIWLTIGEILDLSNLGLSDFSQIEGLGGLMDLKSLILNNNHFTNFDWIEELSNFPKLRAIYLNNNQITEIDGSEFPLCLHLVLLADNQIKKIKNLPLNQTIWIL